VHRSIIFRQLLWLNVRHPQNSALPLRSFCSVWRPTRPQNLQIVTHSVFDEVGSAFPSTKLWLNVFHHHLSTLASHRTTAGTPAALRIAAAKIRSPDGHFNAHIHIGRQNTVGLSASLEMQNG